MLRVNVGPTGRVFDAEDEEHRPPSKWEMVEHLIECQDDIPEVIADAERRGIMPDCIDVELVSTARGVVAHLTIWRRRQQLH